MKGILNLERSSLGGRNLTVQKKIGSTSYPIHWHSHYEIIYYGKCNGVCILNGETYKITDNCVFFLTPTDFHEIKNEDNQDSYSIKIFFSENSIDNKILCKALTSAHVMYDVNPFIQNLFLQMHSSFFDSKIKRKKDLLYYILNLIILYVEEHGTPAGFNNTIIHPIIKDSIMYLITSNDRDIKLSTLAKKFGLSPSYYSDLFHKETGMTFKSYVNNLKIDYAKRLLETTDMHIIDICYECGFENNSHFVRTFSEYTGLSPSAYRKNLNAKK